MNNPGKSAAQTLALVGGIMVALTLLLMYQLSEAQSRSETFTFTVVFLCVQEVLFFGTLACNSLYNAKNTSNFPLQLAYVSSIVLYNFIAIITVILFSFVPYLLNGHSNIYITIALTETGLCLALIVILRMVDIAHRHSHLDASQARNNIELMLHTCDRIFALNHIHKWKLADLLHQVAERIRFSEGLRRNRQLCAELLALLNELELLITASGNDDAEQRAAQLANTILVYASRHA